MNGAAPASGLVLSCQPGRAGRLLFFAYTARNAAAEDLYVMDATPGMDPLTRQFRADPGAVVVVLSDDGAAVVGRFIAPPPTDRRIAVPVVPLATKLAPGATLERRLEVRMPLAETSPYFPDLPLRAYEIVDFAATVFAIGYWRAGTKGLAAAPAPFAPEFHMVTSPDPARDAAHAWQRFPTKGLEMFKRTDAFPRALALKGLPPPGAGG